jgi:hypothetical protein
MNCLTVQKKCRERAGRLNPSGLLSQLPAHSGIKTVCLLEKRLIARWFLILVCFSGRAALYHVIEIFGKFLAGFVCHAFSHLFGPASHRFGIFQVTQLAWVGEIFERRFFRAHPCYSRDELVQLLSAAACAAGLAGIGNDPHEK